MLKLLVFLIAIPMAVGLAVYAIYAIPLPGLPAPFSKARNVPAMIASALVGIFLLYMFLVSAERFVSEGWRQYDTALTGLKGRRTCSSGGGTLAIGRASEYRLR